jgi:hypothetical protein
MADPAAGPGDGPVMGLVIGLVISPARHRPSGSDDQATDPQNEEPP